MSAGIYQIRNKVNGKVYVGKAKNISARWKQHLDELEKGTHSNKPLLYEYNKYGIENFEFSVLETIDTNIEDIDDTLDKLEAYHGMKQETLDSSTGYNFLSRFKYECKESDSMKMLNEHRVKICKELGAECLAVYSSLLAHYDYGKHLVIIQANVIANETGLSKEKIRKYIRLLKEINFIKETSVVTTEMNIKFFKIRKNERNNLESTRYKNYRPENAESEVQVYKEIEKSLEAKIDRIVDEYWKNEDYHKKYEKKLSDAVDDYCNKYWSLVKNSKTN